MNVSIGYTLQICSFICQLHSLSCFVFFIFHLVYTIYHDNNGRVMSVCFYAFAKQLFACLSIVAFFRSRLYFRVNRICIFDRTSANSH